SQANATTGWSWEQRKLLGQRILRELAEDILCEAPKKTQFYRNDYRPIVQSLLASLELDGYIYKENRLYESEAAVLDTEEEAGLLASLVNELGLDEDGVIKNHLVNSEDHYQNGKWGDCISNSRNVLEGVLRNIANQHSFIKTGKEL